MGLFGVLTKFFKKPPAAPTELDEAVRSFQDKTGVRFNDIGLLRVALTHGSYVHEHPDTGLESMGRMELLGDSVLGLVVNEYLYASFPASEEGELTKMKSLLVSKPVLARRGRNMRLGYFLLLGEGEVDAGGRDRTSIVADGYESVIGAIYLDQGLEGAKKFIEDTLLREARRILADSKHMNYKSLLQEQVQGELRVHPEYRVLSETGPEHEKLFTVEVSVKRKVLGRGTGNSKKEAEQAAARDTLSGFEQTGAGQSREGGRERVVSQVRTVGQGRGVRRDGGRRRRDGGADRTRSADQNRGQGADQNRDRSGDRTRSADQNRGRDQNRGQGADQNRDRDQNLGQGADQNRGRSQRRGGGRSRSRYRDRARPRDRAAGQGTVTDQNRGASQGAAADGRSGASPDSGANGRPGVQDNDAHGQRDLNQNRPPDAEQQPNRDK
jgi:ribonuclease-3